ncbi:hypothetical protein [Actomonas aquatica]|uniref:Lipoprotein n=1 Tax=Actomonas aquatica TaxID=2866162 RepID=A0ABZ1CBM7_9BACT|nr:hypothetical protein [Opitutus sp. WL0086]WRQ89084.1 hypothetical protein K1X11_006665 [Opitutus sp. WL0086]
MPSRLALIATLGALLLAGCAREEIRTYRVPKEDPMAAVPPAMRTASGATVPTDAGAAAQLAWSAPAHWQEQEASGFRRGSFTIPGDGGASADLSIIAFPGDAGGLGANLNRWRGQIGLPELPEADVQATVEHVDTPTFHVDFIDYLGEADGAPTRIVGAILHFGNESWFFKLMGPAELVAAETPNFRAFVDTVAPAPAP